MNIGESHTVQMTLGLEGDLTDRYRSAKEAMAAGVYRRGLKRVAADVDVAPGNLSVMLSGDGQRHLDVDLLERYVESTGDITPVLYLVAKHCGARVNALLNELPGLLAAAGANTRKGARK